MLKTGQIRVHHDLHHEIKSLALEKRITITQLIEEILLEYYNQENIEINFKPSKHSRPANLISYT